MIRLFKVKEKEKEMMDSANENGKPPAKEQSPGGLRLHKDIAELNLPKATTIAFPNGKDDLMNFESTIRPDEGYYVVEILFLPSKFLQLTRMNLLKSSARLRGLEIPPSSAELVLTGTHECLSYATQQPNDEDPLNHDAAAVLRDDPKKFESNVRRLRW